MLKLNNTRFQNIYDIAKEIRMVDSKYEYREEGEVCVTQNDSKLYL